MKTREQIYSNEAKQLLRDITTYHCIMKSQLIKLYPGKEQKIENLLSYFVKQGRIYHDNQSDVFFDNEDMQSNSQMLDAIWILADFIENTEYHSADEFPIQLIFFADGETYEVISMPKDKATLIEQALAHIPEESAGKRIIIVENVNQIEHINIENAVFCTVDTYTGDIQYYKRE